MDNNGGVIDEMISRAKSGSSVGPGTGESEGGTQRGSNNVSRAGTTSSDKGPVSSGPGLSTSASQVGNGAV